MPRPYLTVVIPAWNEANRLPLTLLAIDQYLARQEYSYEIIVVNDGSTDATSEATRKTGDFIENVKCIDSPEHRGKGSALRIGMAAAKGNWRLAMDADGSVGIEEFSRMEPYRSPKSGNGVIVGSHSARGAEARQSISLAGKIAEGVVNWIAVRLLGIKTNDCSVGFQCFSGEAADAVFEKTRLDGSATVYESVALAERLGYYVHEVPVRIERSEVKSRFKLRTYLQTLRDVSRMRWWLAHGGYSLETQDTHPASA
jgi:glycosyltransferase involved in cell wall biosynthesis